MESPEGSTFARFGGAMLLVSLVLPYFAMSFAGFGSHGFRLWSVDKGAMVLVAAYGLLALSQVKMGSRDSMAVIYLVIGGLFTAALIYRIYISPPGSAPLGDFMGGLGDGGASGSGSLTVNGKSTAGISANDFLEALGIELKPSYGSYVAILGSAFFTVGAFLEFRASGNAKAAAAAMPAQPVAPQPMSPGDRYQGPAVPQRTFAPDPFAVPAQGQAAAAQPAAAPVVPPDPFAPKPAQPAPAQPYVAPAPPAQQPYSPPGPPAA